MGPSTNEREYTNHAPGIRVFVPDSWMATPAPAPPAFARETTNLL